MFALPAFGNGQRVRVVHGCPRFRNEVGGMGIRKTGPEEKMILRIGVLVEQVAGAFGDPGIVVKFFGKLPGIVLRVGYGSGRSAEVIPPLREAL